MLEEPYGDSLESKTLGPDDLAHLTCYEVSLTWGAQLE